MQILNLYAGIGGNRKLWGEEHTVVAVENNEQIATIYHDFFPKDTIVIADAHEFLLKHLKEFDFIWSSPPCPTHSRMKQMNMYAETNELVYPEMELYQEILLLKYFAPKETSWVVENVIPYYDPLIKPMMELDRHCFWSNFYIPNKAIEKEKISIVQVQSNILERFGFDLNPYKFKVKNLRQIIRNMVDPQIGLYLLLQSQKHIQPLFNFNY